MEPNKQINVAKIMENLRKSMSSHIKRNSERFFPQPVQEPEQVIEIEPIPVQESVQPKSVQQKKTVKNIGRFSNFAAGKESKMVEDGGKI